MAIVPMADAVPGAIASSSEYNKLIDNIEDLNSRLHMSVANQAARDGLTKYAGLTIYRQDTKWIEVYDGSFWRVQGPIAVSSSANLSLVTSPYAGLMAWVTGTSTLYEYTGSAWRVAVVNSSGVADARYRASGTPQAIAAATDTKVRFATAEQTGSDVTASGTNNETFTLNRSGLWVLNATVRFGAGTAGERYLAIGDADIDPRWAQQSVFPGTAPASFGLTATVRLAAGTAVSVWAYSSTAVNLEYSWNGVSFAATWLRN